MIRDVSGADEPCFASLGIMLSVRSFSGPGLRGQPQRTGYIPPSRGDAQATHREWKIVRVALERAQARIASLTAHGLDGIPAGLVKRLEQIARKRVAAVFTGIIEENAIPEDWLRSHVCLVLKKGADSSFLSSYRPITVARVLYMLFAQVVKEQKG
ncbi:hypothetical protein MRX96_047099 [Rhipicephalus microplus]